MTHQDATPHVPIFNSPFETGVRAVFILQAMYPRAFDLERLVALDHLVVHAADIGGPESLHPSTSTHASEMLVRRELINDGLLLMQTRLLIVRVADDSGISYRAGPEAATFVRLHSTNYFLALYRAAAYLADRLKNVTDRQFDELVERQLERWAIQFQPIIPPHSGA